MRLLIVALSLIATMSPTFAQEDTPPVVETIVSEADAKTEWTSLPDLPDELGVAGPIVGVHNDVLILAGGANFPVAEGEDLWDVPKVYHDKIWTLHKSQNDDDETTYAWQDSGRLERPLAYAPCATTSHGVVAIGGCDSADAFAECFLLRWDTDKKQVVQTTLPSLPTPCAFGAAAAIGDVVYLAGGQTGTSLDTATKNFYRLDLSEYDPDDKKPEWEKLPSWDGPPRAVCLAAAQNNGFDDCVYVMSGRHEIAVEEGDPEVEFLTDVYEFNPQRYSRENDQSGWRRRADTPHCVMAGSAAPLGQSHIYVLGGGDGSLFHRTNELLDDHPGFPRRALAYHTITDTWIDAGPIPKNHVTTPAVVWDGRIIIASGEVRPRVRTSAVWAVKPIEQDRNFGITNFTVLGLYLAAMIGVGVYFSRKTKSTDDYFRGGQRVVWWAAGCSIFATMLSSITYMAVPALAFSQDIVYLIGNMMILAVAPIAIYLALPFFRAIDATSAYEYLEMRFNRPVRLLASTFFTMFHIFRMGIVMSLAALALATITPLSPVQSVLIMGVLSIAYCTLGGIEAVVWTDTIQTFVLLGGAMLCFILIITKVDGGAVTMFQNASEAGKLRVVNLHWDPTSAQLAIWVVVLGAIGQNIASYTSDQAVVQRYMTTPDAKRAAKSIWTAAFLAVPATFLFFLLGTALWGFYSAYPDRLDPTFKTDQIFPLFIANETPIGVAGLIVAGIFAAAQSTISTSMNSTATTVVTDFLRPFNALKSERGYLVAARWITFTLGVLGTILGLLFVDPSVQSLFKEFIKIIGLFMGVLGGLFALGILTRRVGGIAALCGAIGGFVTVMAVYRLTDISGYLFALIGIVSCVLIGLLLSVFTTEDERDITGLTIYTLKKK